MIGDQEILGFRYLLGIKLLPTLAISKIVSGPSGRSHIYMATKVFYLQKRDINFQSRTLPMITDIVQKSAFNSLTFVLYISN